MEDSTMEKNLEEIDTYLQNIVKEEEQMLNTDILSITEAIAFFEWAKEQKGTDSVWSIQYWGFGEHFTHWSGDGTFLDFNIDKGQGISWYQMKGILVESANNLREVMREWKKIKGLVE